MRKQILLCILLGLAAVVLWGCRAKRLPEGVSVETLRYETWFMMAGSETSLSISREDDGFTVVRTVGWEEPSRRAHGSAQMGKNIADILREHDVLSWDGFSGHDPLIDDGESFTLTIAFDDGTTISARGTNRRPKGMGQAMREIENLFDQLLWEPEQ
ncbi:MAG: hypothetical protein IKU34_10915 [Clostridia bacterium]|nr:hypothetical protein [Clostridia bacterium]